MIKYSKFDQTILELKKMSKSINIFKDVQLHLNLNILLLKFTNSVNPLSSVYGCNTGYTGPFKLPCHTDNAALIEQKWAS